MYTKRKGTAEAWQSHPCGRGAWTIWHCQKVTNHKEKWLHTSIFSAHCRLFSVFCFFFLGGGNTWPSGRSTDFINNSASQHYVLEHCTRPKL